MQRQTVPNVLGGCVGPFYVGWGAVHVAQGHSFGYVFVAMGLILAAPYLKLMALLSLIMILRCVRVAVAHWRPAAVCAGVALMGSCFVLIPALFRVFEPLCMLITIPFTIKFGRVAGRGNRRSAGRWCALIVASWALAALSFALYRDWPPADVCAGGAVVWLSYAPSVERDGRW